MKSPDKRDGFTLIELMVVVIIIAALASMVLPRLLPVADEAKMKVAAGEIASIKTAVKLYYLKYDEYPANLDAAQPYLEKKPVDPWGNKYQYERAQKKAGNWEAFRIRSAGPDEQMGTEDDVDSWETGKK